MALTNPVKTDWTPSDGVTDQKLNDIGSNLNSLESSKAELTGNNTYTGVNTFNGQVKYKRYLSATGATQNTIFDILTTWTPNTNDYMTCTGTIKKTGGGGGFIVGLLSVTGGSNVSVTYINKDTLNVTTAVMQNGNSTVIPFIEIMSNFDKQNA
jgi:hypothetical protein